VLSGNGSDELFTGYQGDEVARQQDIADKPGIIRGLFSRTKTVPLTWARSLFPAKDDKKTSPFLETVLVELARDMEQQGVNNHMDLMMFLRLALGGSDSNFRIPDISGLAAQVEVRSPYFDHRLVEFAARLPHQYKIGDPDNGHLNKYLPKVFYEKLVGKEIAWTSKKGMGYNLRWDESIAMAPEFKDAFISAYDNLDHNGLDSGHFRRAWGEYIAQKLGGVKFPATAGEMMSGFMLGEWLRRVHPALQVY
jgi:asparagine synthase (glutamine-hydrolysing)